MLRLWWAYLSSFSRREWLGILIGITLIAACSALWGAGYLKQFWNFGFGPDWQCTYPGKGEPVCIK